MSEACKESCELCKHVFEAKPRTEGEKWAEVDKNSFCYTVTCPPSWVDVDWKRDCSRCRGVQAQAYDKGRASRDKEVGLITEQAEFLDGELDKVEAGQPKPAMTVDEYRSCGGRITREQVMGYPNDTLSIDSYINILIRILDDYRKLNKGKVILWTKTNY